MNTTSVSLDSKLVNEASDKGKALNRSIPEQVEHWIKIGKIMEDNPDLTYDFVKHAVASKSEIDAGKTEPYTFSDYPWKIWRKKRKKNIPLWVFSLGGAIWGGIIVLIALWFVW